MSARVVCVALHIYDEESNHAYSRSINSVTHHIAAYSAESPCPTPPGPPHTPQPADQVCRARFPAGRAETVYVVEDDQGDRNAIGRILNNRGYAVEAFADCSAFLAAFRPSTRGCLLVDGLILGVDGIDIIEHLRDQCDEFPTIVMSADASASMVVQTMKAGAVDYIEKPIGPEELFSNIRQALDQPRDADGLRIQEEGGGTKIERPS
jgi:CheY-like chemotaxis protein